MYATDFEFNGELASNHGLMVCTWGDESDVAEGGNIEPNTFKPPNRDTFDWYGGQFNEPLVWNMSIANSMCPYVVTETKEIVNGSVVIYMADDLVNYECLSIDTTTIPEELTSMTFIVWDVNMQPEATYSIAKADLDSFILDVKNKGQIMFYPVGVLNFTLDINFTTLPNMETEISIEREREIARWLMKPGYKWTRFLNDRDGSESLWYKCNVSVTPHQLFGSTIGFDLTFTSNCAYGFTDEQVITDVVSSSNPLTFNISTDINEYVYPIITLGGKGEIELYNENDLEQNLINAKQTKVMVKSDVSNEIDEVIVGNISPNNTKNVKGTSININDATDNKLRTINIMGKSEQETTNGYQLLEYMTVGRTYTEHGITITVLEDGKVHIEGTSTDQVTFFLHNDDSYPLPRGIYTLQLKDTVGYARVYVDNENSYTTTTVLDFTQEGSHHWLDLRIPRDVTMNGTMQIMLVSGETERDYEEYTYGPTPNIHIPQPITDITEEEIEVTNGTDTQTCNLDLTLRGIPVSSGGNYIDNNDQHWICDTIERYTDGSGKLIRRIRQVVYNGQESWNDYQGDIVFCNFGTTNRAIYSNATYKRSFNTHFLTLKSNATQVAQNDNVYYVSTSYIACSPTIDGVRLDKDEFKQYLSNNPMTLDYCLETPVETLLTQEQLSQLDLSTYYPNTTITSNTDVECEYVFSNEVYPGYIEEPTVFELNVSNLEDRDIQISQEIVANVNPEKLTHIGLRIIGVNNNDTVTELYTGYDKYINLTLSDNIKTIVGQVMYWHSGILDAYTEQFDCKVQIYNKGSVILDADNDIITGITNPKTDFNYYFPHLVDGENVIKTTSDTDVDIEIKYREARRVIL